MIRLLNNIKLSKLIPNNNIFKNTNLLVRALSTTPNLLTESNEGGNYLTWQNLKLHPTLINLCELNKLNQPNRIQFNSLQSLLNKEDTLIEAETGSGKTQAYILLTLQKLIEVDTTDIPDSKAPLVMIMVPNKELIWQITKSFLQFKPILNEFNIKITHDKLEFKQANNEQSKIIYIGTPSQLFNNLTKRELNELSKNLEYLKLCVLDEVDFLLSRSYLVHTREMIPYLYRILSQNDGIFALVGATSGPRKEEPFNSKLLQKYFRGASRVTSDDLHRLRDKLDVEMVKPDDNLTTVELNDWKLNTLQEKLKGYILDKIEKLKANSEEGNKSINIILFANSANNVNLYSDYLSSNLNLTPDELGNYKLDVHQFHKNIPILTREESLKQVILTTNEPQINLIVSTDLLSRGIDLPLIDLVIQADIPSNIVSYIHRSGRTARFNRAGKMICLVTKLDGHLGELILKGGELPKIEANIDEEEAKVQTKKAADTKGNKKLDEMFSKRRSLNKKVKRYNEVTRGNQYN
jgi:superfamily II DNA/RNA helicase